MLVNSERNCAPLIANDGCCIRELLHPRHETVALPFSLAIAEVAPGERTFRHRLAQLEVYYLIDGTARVHVADEIREVAAGDAVLIPAGEVQWIENTGDRPLRFAAIVSPPWHAAAAERLD